MTNPHPTGSDAGAIQIEDQMPTKYELDHEAFAGMNTMPEPAEEAVDRAAHILSEWLDDAAPLHEQRYREPAKAVLKFAAYFATRASK